MPKAKSFVKQTLKLSKLVAFNKKGVIIPLEDVENYMSELYFHCKEAQNYYVSVKFGDDAISREFGTHTTSKQRESFISAYSLPKNWKSCVDYNRNNIEESCRVLKSWQEREEIANFIISNPNITNKNIVEKIEHFVNYRLISNIRRSKRHQTMPSVKNARIILGKDVNIVEQLCPDGIWLHNVHITDKTIDLFFPVSKKIYANLGKIVKIGAPIIRLDGNNNFVFDFLVKTQRKTPKNKPNFLGVDLKLNGGFAAAVISGETKQISGYIEPSVQVQRCQKKINHISNDIGLKRKKANNIRACKNPNWNKINLLEAQIKYNREKRKRIESALDWQAANDLVNYAEQTNSIICYENVKCNLGGRLHFRSTLKRIKVKHVAAKHGIQVTDVNAAYTSQNCPKCDNKVKKTLNQRVHKCGKCGLKCDRDYAAAINMAKRGGNINDPRWTKAIESKKQITMKKSSGKRADSPIGELSRQRIILNRGNSARRKTIIVENYLVGTISYVSNKQKTSTIDSNDG